MANFCKLSNYLGFATTRWSPARFVSAEIFSKLEMAIKKLLDFEWIIRLFPYAINVSRSRYTRVSYVETRAVEFVSETWSSRTFKLLTCYVISSFRVFGVFFSIPPGSSRFCRIRGECTCIPSRHLTVV